MRIIYLVVLSLILSLLSGCAMPRYADQIAANEIKLREAGYIHPAKGDPAPPISAFDESGTPFELSAALEQGPVLLFFYPLNDTPNCASQLRQLSRMQADLGEKGKVQVYGINPAPASETAEFLAKAGVSIHVLADPGLQISKAYGCASTEGGTLLQERSVVGIAQDGSIAFFQRRYFHTPPGWKMLLGPNYFNLEPQEEQK